MKSGDLRQTVTLLRPTYSTNAQGRRITAWERVEMVKASKRDVSGRDLYQAQAYHAEDIVTFGIRWRDDITKEWRIDHGGNLYEIVQINHLGYKRDYMHIKTRMIDGEGR